jgi:hypothetical protein
MMTEKDVQLGNHGSAAVPLGAAEPAVCPLTPGWKRFSKRVIQVGFLFFLLKGIAWLVVGFIAWQGLS